MSIKKEAVDAGGARVIDAPHDILAPTPPAARGIEGKQSKGHIGCYGAARILER
jgi:hypothetical protein